MWYEFVSVFLTVSVMVCAQPLRPFLQCHGTQFIMSVSVDKTLFFQNRGYNPARQVRHKEISNNITTSRLSLEPTLAVNTHAQLPPVSFFWRDFEISVIQELQ